MERTFIYNGQKFPDPDPNLSVDEVKAAMADFMPELATADVTETDDGETKLVEFKRKVGTKGANHR